MEVKVCSRIIYFVHNDIGLQDNYFLQKNLCGKTCAPTAQPELLKLEKVGDKYLVGTATKAWQDYARGVGRKVNQINHKET